MQLRQSDECGAEVIQTDSESSDCGNNNLVSNEIGRYVLILIFAIFAYVVQWFWIK
jgi:hypothetical protein